MLGEPRQQRGDPGNPIRSQGQGDQAAGPRLGSTSLSPRCGLGVLFRMIQKKAGEEGNEACVEGALPGGV